MEYALTITIAVGLAILLLIAGVFLSARRLAGAAARGEAPFGRWSWLPSPWVFLLLPALGLLLWRLFPAFLFIPIILPFFWRLGGERISRARDRHRNGSGPVDAEYRRVDEE